MKQEFLSDTAGSATIMADEIVWKGLKVHGKVFKIISNRMRGYIEIVDEEGEIILRKDNLTSAQIASLEHNFFKKGICCSSKRLRKSSNQFDPMVN